MHPGRITNSTRNLGAPDGHDRRRDGVCTSLAIRDERRPNGQNQMISAWYPTPEEITAIGLGAPVYLLIIGERHPPVALGVGPVTDFEPPREKVR